MGLEEFRVVGAAVQYLVTVCVLSQVGVPVLLHAPPGVCGNPHRRVEVDERPQDVSVVFQPHLVGQTTFLLSAMPTSWWRVAASTFFAWVIEAICVSANVTVASSKALRAALTATLVVWSLSFMLTAIPSAADSWLPRHFELSTSYRQRRVLPATRRKAPRSRRWRPLRHELHSKRRPLHWLRHRWHRFPSRRRWPPQHASTGFCSISNSNEGVHHLGVETSDTLCGRMSTSA